MKSEKKLRLSSFLKIKSLYYHILRKIRSIHIHSCYLTYNVIDETLSFILIRAMYRFLYVFTIMRINEEVLTRIYRMIISPLYLHERRKVEVPTRTKISLTKFYL